MDVIYAIIAGLQSLIGKTPGQRRRNCRVALLGVSVVAIIAFSIYSVHASRKINVQVDAAKEEEPPEESEEPPGKAVEETEHSYGMESIIAAVRISQDTESDVHKLGTSCEAVLVGQRVGKNVQESHMDFGEAAAESVANLEDHSRGASEKYLQFTDRDYETLLKIVEAEAGGEDLQGRIMVANVIFNRMKSPEFPDTVYDIVWEKTAGTPEFSPTADGRIHTVTVSEETREAVNRAIDGEDYSEGALFFMQEEYSDSANVSWFKKNLKYLFSHGVHDFYTYPE